MVNRQLYGVRSSVRWDPAVEAYFTACFGGPRLAAISTALARPSLTPTLRINTLQSRPQDVIQKLQQELRKQQLEVVQDQDDSLLYSRQLEGERPSNQREDGERSCSQQVDGEISDLLRHGISRPSFCVSNAQRSSSTPSLSSVLGAPSLDVPGQRTQPLAQPMEPPLVRLHPRVPAVAVLTGRGPFDVDVSDADTPEVVVNRFAGEAVLKGSHVYVPGVLAASSGIAAGDLVVVSAALERPVGPFGVDGLEVRDAQAQTASTHRSMPARTRLSKCGTRLAVGISRGSTVAADGSVPLAWVRKARVNPRQSRRGEQQPQQHQQGPQGTPHSTHRNERDAGDAPYNAPQTAAHGIRLDSGSNSCSRSSISTWDSCSDGGSDSNDLSGSSSSDSTSSISSSGFRDGSGQSSRSRSVSKDSGSEEGRSSNRSHRSERIFLGLARAKQGRRAMFRAKEGLALQMERRLYDVPSCNGLLRGEVMLQALPSIIAAQVLNPRPGACVLDMCAAPGGKTTLLAALLGNYGKVVALDRSAAKVAEIMSLARDLGVSCIEAYQADATDAAAAAEEAPGPHKTAAALVETRAVAMAETQLVKALHLSSSSSPMYTVGAAAAVGETPPPNCMHSTATNRWVTGPHESAGSVPGRPPSAALPPAPPLVSTLLGPPPYPPGTFDYILLDPPCSALGLRPRLLHSWTLPHLRAMAAYQRSLLYTAVQLLKPGGEMVYCTCTINPDENEANIVWALDRFASSLELLPAHPLLGLPGLTGGDPDTGQRWLSDQEALMVQRFDPGLLLPGRRMAPLVQELEKETAATETAGSAVMEAANASSVEVAAAEGNAAAPSIDGGALTSLADDVMGFFIARFRKIA